MEPPGAGLGGCGIQDHILKDKQRQTLSASGAEKALSLSRAGCVRTDLSRELRADPFRDT